MVESLSWAARCLGAAFFVAVAVVQLRSYAYGIIAQEVERRLVPALADATDKGAVVDTQDVFRRFAFDTVHKISFDLDPGCLEPEMPESRFTAASRLRAVCVRRRVAGGVEQGSIERINRRGREVRAEEDKIRSKCFLYNQWH
jgi:12-hydroxyjasmonoyl-L-amino acid 12-hydroxylase / fatty acid hydroxylase